MGGNDTEAPVAILERWEHHGAVWRAVGNKSAARRLFFKIVR